MGRGYLNRPELTSERFIPNPFEDSPGQRLYRTGDLARYLADGNIQFLGRLDHQLKVGGYRIEAGEIETVLSQHPEVRESVVVALEDSPGLKRLVAYIVPVSEQAVNISELRSYLRNRFPVYMVPHTFVLLEQMPRTPNGKTDRQALPSPAVGRTEKEKTLIAPRSTLELQLAKLWERTLGIQPIGVTENFFDLGGHSLLAVRLFAQIEKVFGRDLPLATLYTAPTVEQLAEILSREGLSVPWTLMVPIQVEGNRPPFFLHHGTEALTQGVEKDQPFYLLRPHGIDGRRAPRSIEEMAADYIREIRALQPEGPYYLGGYSLGGVVAFETAQQLRRQGHEVALLLLLDPTPPFEWEEKIEEAIAGQSSGGKRLLEKIKNGWQKMSQLGMKQKLRFIREGLRWRMNGGWKCVERVLNGRS